jgi:3-methyladenine DNA glycosylase AlkD
VSAASASPAASPVTAASNRFVAAHLPAARELGRRLPALVSDPDAFAGTLTAGFTSLGDPVYAAGVRSVTPGLGPVFGVRQPLMAAAHREFRRGSRQVPASQLLDCAARLFHEEHRELRWFAIWILGRGLSVDPDRTWQLLRQAAGCADEWITVDTLAHPWGEGILAEPDRWSELDRLLVSPSRWERRLVGSTVATMPHGGAARTHGPIIRERGLALMARLIGDAEPDVQKALSWALRSLADLDRPATTAFLDAEARTARATADGHRAWVIRDTLNKTAAPDAARLRAELDGIRRRPGAPSTSLAATASAAPAARTPLQE